MQREEVKVNLTTDFEYIPYKDGISIKAYKGTEQNIIIPDYIDDKPVKKIERKAFLSCKKVVQLQLSSTVEEIGDWAFAHMESLKKVIIPSNLVSKGKEMFLGCKALEEILISDDEEKMQESQSLGIGGMLAISIKEFNDYFMLDPDFVGSDKWISRWDETLIDFINTDDLEGYQELWTCGEEDYEGAEYDIKLYPIEKRKIKLRIVYFRLLHQYKLDDAVKKELENYLLKHTIGTPQPQAWEILVNEHANDLEYYKLFTQTGCINEETFDLALANMENVNAEIRAYMLRYKEENFAKDDVFAEFELGW